ncbi:adenosylcobinamide kinase /adenosylcobinamide-phosphate guanylyltransferase [Anaerobacterium chartisolvens]|uniref:Bifunctional adenosylcobalamin biosynthesis protein CobU n=1 Tax=Anaerobacterium chartisolvens TaxID=1297424 RepID=A0A369B805_9FIRM|nr:bifunctional adenosylcobinamide kinase/adenosylcobinamide-phosphate guanylyltransferase [Anaerobacterium chartisolvens]RCX17561.1 adenosylcobinamide kinase /adenosylcobinamide-phosphate guanylyltransferase [Anaerobacterium chartisolvens]
MGRLILVTGGARSGKSRFAEELAKGMGNSILYIATAVPLDEEMRDRISRHRQQRPEHWETLEAHRDLDEALRSHAPGKDGVLLDCVTIMVTNLMFESYTDWEAVDAFGRDEVEKNIKIEIKKLINEVKGLPMPFIAVTNETGMGLVPEYASARAFRDMAGRVNQMLAEAAGEVYFCVSGIPVRIK